LSNLLNGIGKSLSPQVRCAQKSARGIIEVKGTNDDAWIVANGEQVSRYWGK
jgi:hypothetical protein